MRAVLGSLTIPMARQVQNVDYFSIGLGCSASGGQRKKTQVLNVIVYDHR